MDDAPSYVPPFTLGAAVEGNAVGEVVASRSEAVLVGATVSHFLGWREYAVLDAAAVTVDTGIAPPQAYLGALGTTGLTALAALTEIAPVREGDVVFVFAAAGAVGSVVGQLARKLGASKVVGSAGGSEKTKKLVTEFGDGAATDYRAGSLDEQLAKAAPEGIDAYLDSVDGDHLRAAVGATKAGGRIALVGAISGIQLHRAGRGPRPVPGHRQGAHPARHARQQLFPPLPEWIGQTAARLADGTLHSEQTVFAGIEQAPAAFLGMMRGAHIGKMLVRMGG